MSFFVITKSLIDLTLIRFCAQSRSLNSFLNKMESKSDPPTDHSADMDVIIQTRNEHDDDPLPMEDEPEKVYDDELLGPIVEKLLIVVNSKYFALVMMVLTIYALFGDDVRLIASEKPDDAIFFTISIIALAFFTLELTLNMISKSG